MLLGGSYRISVAIYIEPTVSAGGFIVFVDRSRKDKLTS